MLGKGKTAGAGDHRMQGDIAEFCIGIFQKVRKCLLNVGKMPFIIGEQNLVIFVQNGDFNCGGTDVDSEGILHLIHKRLSLSSY